LKKQHLAFCLLLFVFSISLTTVGDEVKPETVIIAGTGDSQSLLRSLSKEFEKYRLGQNIKVLIPDSVGSSGGIKALIKGKATYARTARPLKKSEKNNDLKQNLFALSPVVIVVHPSVEGIDNLTSQQVVGIFERKYRNWVEIGGPNNPIYAVQRELGDSSRNILEQQISGFGGHPDIKTYFTTPKAAQAISQHKFTIGYLPKSTAKAYNLKILSINGIEATEKNVLKGKYPLVIPYFIVTKGTPTKTANQFLIYLYSKSAKDQIRKYGAIPSQ